jgi:ketosteroid isomerase-like protein
VSASDDEDRDKSTTEAGSELLGLLVRHTDAWNSHDLEDLMSLFADDCVFEASGGEEVTGKRFEGHVDVRRAFADVLESMPDAQWGGDRHHVLAHDYGVSEWTLTGTLPDGRRVEADGCDFLRVSEGKIVLKSSFRKQRPPF